LKVPCFLFFFKKFSTLQFFSLIFHLKFFSQIFLFKIFLVKIFCFFSQNFFLEKIS